MIDSFYANDFTETANENKLNIYIKVLHPVEVITWFSHDCFIIASCVSCEYVILHSQTLHLVNTPLESLRL